MPMNAEQGSPTKLCPNMAVNSYQSDNRQALVSGF